MLEPQFNKYPKPTDWNSLIILAQQAFENGFRGPTFQDLANRLSIVLGPNIGSAFDSTVVSDGGTLPEIVPDEKRWLFVGPGTYNNPTGGTITVDEPINVVATDGTTYHVVLEIPINLEGYALKGGSIAPGSPDSVAGGDIYDVIRPASQSVGKVLDPFHVHDNLFIWFNGFPDNNSNYAIRQYNVESGKTYLLDIQITSPDVGGGGIGVYGFYETTEFSSLVIDTLLLQPPETTRSYLLPLTAPEDATILNVTVHKSSGYCNVHEYLSLGEATQELAYTSEKTDNNEVELEKLTGAVFSNVVTVVVNSTIDGQYLNSVGTGNLSGDYELRTFAVKPGGYYKVTGQLTSAVDPGPTTLVGRFGFYTNPADLGTLISGSLVTQVEGTTQSYSTVVQSPDTGTFMMVSIKKGDDSVIVEELANPADVIARFPSIITCWGDSITWGAAPEDNVPWVQRLQTLFGTRLRVVNCGVGGEGMRQVAARQGGVPMYNSSAFMLPSSAASTVQVGTWSSWVYDGFFKSSKDNGNVPLLLQGESGRDEGFMTVNPCYVDGIECTLAIDISNWDPLTATYTLKRNQNGSANRVIAAGTPLFTAAAKNLKQSASVFWFGTNDAFGGGAVDVPELIDWYRRCIAYSGASRYVVVGIYGGTGISGMSVGDLEDMEAEMFAAFGLHYFNIRRYAITNALGDAGITPTGGDTAAIAAGQCPPSLLADEVHPNAAFSQLIAARIYDILLNTGV